MSLRASASVRNLLINERWGEAMERLTKTEEVTEELRRRGGAPKNLPLHSACAFGAPFELVEAILEAYPDAVRIPNKNGDLPLHWACGTEAACPRVVQLLLEAYPEGAKAPERTFGWLPLHKAADRRQPLEVVRMLVDAYPQGITTTDKRNGWLPLHVFADREFIPIDKEDVELADLLLHPLLDDEDACLIPCPSSGVTPLHIAADFDLLTLDVYVRMPRCPAEVIARVARRHPGQLRERDEDGNLPLHKVAANRNLNGAKDQVGEDLVGRLVTSYPEAASAYDGEGRSPLVLAIESGKKWDEGVGAITDAALWAIVIRDEATGLFPFMLAATRDSPCLSTVYGLLVRCPELGRYALN